MPNQVACGQNDLEKNKVSSVPFFDLKRQYAGIRGEVEEAVAKVFESQQFILGPEAVQFEKEMAAFCGVEKAIGVSSGTDALLLALMALGIQAGDEVITSPFTFFATGGSIARLGAHPVFVDIDPKTMNLDPALIEEKITPKTKAIMPVHIFGQCADMDRICAIAKKHKLFVVEDAAQAIGALYNQKQAGSFGDFGCFSFFPTKNLGACGEGGLVTSSTPELAEQALMLRAHGAKTEYYHEAVGGNFRIHGLQAAILRVKLRYLDKWNDQRRKNAARYNELFAQAGFGGSDDVKEARVVVPFETKNCKHVYHQYVIKADKRDELAQYLKDNGIGSKVYYPVALHQQQCFSYLGAVKSSCPVSEQCTAQVLALPIFPELEDLELQRVVSVVKDFYSK